jgi:uncharacterized protein
LVSLGYFPVGVASGFEAPDDVICVGLGEHHVPGDPVPHLYSMGAAVAVMAAARDERIKAIVSDSPFASERKLVRSLLKKRLNPIHGPVAALTERLLPYDPGKVEPLKEVARIAPAQQCSSTVCVIRRASRRIP